MRTYYILELGDAEDARELQKKQGMGQIATDLSEYAKQAADYCHAYRDGWEWNWPKTFVILDEGIESARFRVDRVTVPEFVTKKL